MKKRTLNIFKNKRRESIKSKILLFILYYNNKKRLSVDVDNFNPIKNKDSHLSIGKSNGGWADFIFVKNSRKFVFQFFNYDI